MSIRSIYAFLASLTILLGGCADVVTTDGGGGAGGASGMGGAGGGGGGMGGGGGVGGAGGATVVTKTISLGYTNNAPVIFGDVMIVDWELSVAPDGAVAGGTTFDATLDGTAFFPEAILDGLQAIVIGGVKRLAVTELAATVLVRSGASGDPVTLEQAEVSHSCVVDGTACDPTKTQPDGSNEDCIPVFASNECLGFLEVPTSEACAPGAACETFGKESQCEANGFCVTGPIAIKLEAGTGTYTADASGEIRFGWDDENTGATVSSDGTYTLPPAIFSEPAAPNGFRALVAETPGSPLVLALQCTMAVDSGDPPHGVGVPDEASPTPDELLLTIPIVQ